MSALFTRHLTLPVRERQASRSSVHISVDSAHYEPVSNGSNGVKLTGLFDRCKQLYSDWGLNHLVPLVILSLYALAGAAVFYSFENPYETNKKELQKKELGILRESLVANLTRLSRDYPLTVESTKQLILSYEAQLPSNLADLNMLPTWTYLAAIYYAGTIFTTIGYGNIAPATTGGRVCTIIFALIGIPLVLAILNDLGQLLCKWANRSWRRFLDLMRLVQLKHLRLTGVKYFNGHLSNGKSNGFHSALNNNVEAKDLEAGQLSEDREDTEESDKASMPVGLAIFLSIGWLFFCASLFLLWESNWTFFNSFWFFFISLSTIGLGDVVPTNYTYMVVNFYLVLVGLSLVSMTINIIQQRIEELLFNMMKLIQEEYEKMLNDGSLSEEEKAEVIQKVMDRQPFFVRKMLPMVMGERQKGQLEHQCDIVSKAICNAKQTQTEAPVAQQNDSVQTSWALECRSTQTQPIANRSESIQVDIGMVRSESDTSMATSKLIEAVKSQGRRCSNVSVRTCDSDNDVFEDANELPPLPQSHLRRKTFAESRLSPITLETVECQTDSLKDLGLTVDVSTVCQPLLTAEQSAQTPTTAVRQMGINTESKPPRNTGSQTESTGRPPLLQQSSIEVQTDDSYLKIARKLNELKLNRADSLHIMAVPVARVRTGSEVGAKTHRSGSNGVAQSAN